MQTFTNNAYGFLASGVSAVATTLTLGTGEGARFPTTSGDNFKVTLIALSGGQETAWEIVNVTGRSSDTLTVQRAQEGTTALVWPSLTRVELRLTAGATESKANLGTAAYTASTDYAPAAQGVTNGNSHDHNGGDGAQIAYANLSGLPTLGTAAAKNIPATGNASATEVVYGSDTRLSDARTPTTHNHDATYQPLDSDLTAVAGLSTTGLIERTGAGTAGIVTVTAAGKALLDDATAADQRTTLGLPELLTGTKTYYVATTGSDSNNGLSAGAPFLTVQKAIDTVQLLNAGPYGITISVADGTYAGFTTRPFNGYGTAVITGNSGNYSAVTFNTACLFSPNTSLWRLKYLRFAGVDYGCVVGSGTTVLQNVVFSSAGVNCQVVGSGVGVTFDTDNANNYALTVTASCVRVLYVYAGAIVQCPYKKILISNTPTWTYDFVFCQLLSQLSIHGCTITGTASGKRYTVAQNAVVFVDGGGASYLPGSIAGTTETGGLYV